MPKGIKVPKWASTSESLDLAFDWYSACCSGHHRCSLPASSKKGWLPARLIDIGKDADSVWKLVVTSDECCPARQELYMTLSYRWGLEPQEILLLSSNLRNFIQGLTAIHLPRTFRDFALVARRFGIRFVWIDTLCIMQDSDEDWNREAPLMRYVYANSACNIIATASDDPKGGPFRHRDPQSLSIGAVNFPSWSGRSSAYWVFDRTFWDRRIMRRPLHKRGWVFQERLLAPRVLYFTHDQIMWEYLTSAKCETFPNSMPYHVPLKHMNVLWELFDRQKSSDAMKHAATIAGKEVANIWNIIVRNYTYCVLTKASDKLPALAGIARLFQEITGDEYLVGLWRSTMLEQLDWRVHDPVKRTTQEYRAPSWSWASVDGPVRPYGDTLDMKTPLVLRDATAIGVKASGEISSAYLRLQGFLTMGTVKSCDMGHSSDYMLVLSIGTCVIEGQYLRDHLDIIPMQGQTMWVLPCKIHAEDDGEEMKNVLVCLVLEAVLCTTVPTFRRVGVFLPFDSSHQCSQALCLRLTPEGEMASDWKIESSEIVLI